MNALIFSLWGFSVACEIGLVALLVRRRLALLYWGVTIWATISAASGLHLAYSYMEHHRYPWASWQPLLLAGQILVTADVAHKLSRHWPARAFGWIVNGVFGALSLAAMAWVVRLVPAAPWGANEWMLRLSEHFSLACAVTVGLNWLIYSVPLDRWRRNARLHVRASVILAGGCGAACLLAYWSKAYAAVAVANLTLTIAPAAAAILWARMSARGEAYEMERPQAGLLESLEALDAQRIRRLTGE